jgi:hypothetical protein
MFDDPRQDRTLSPTLEDLDRVTGITDLTYAITRFIDPTRSLNGPKNIAYVYLAFSDSASARYCFDRFHAVVRYLISRAATYSERLAMICAD